MFSVYGKSRPIARKVIKNQMLDLNSDINTALLESGIGTQESKQEIVDIHIDEQFKQMKPKRCSQEFSTPEIAKECFALMMKDNDNFSDLSLMKKIEKKKSDTTGKMTYVWVEF